VTPRVAWVLGSGGLLGASVRRRLPQVFPGTAVWTPRVASFSWNNPEALEAELGEAAQDYLSAAGTDAPWMLLWCAGAGVVGTPAEQLGRETRSFEILLDRLGRGGAERAGLFFLSSSAGGLHGGNVEMPLTEETPPRPISDYGRAKLRHEELLGAWAAAHPRVSTLMGRISNLYGPDQKLNKPQGLIAHLSRCLLHHVPAHVYAPLDTLRDHLYAPDAAEQILQGMARLAQLPAPARVIKLIASGQTASIGAILAILSRIAKRQPRIVCSKAAAGKLQPSGLSLKSTVWSDLPLAPPMPLAAGIQSVFAHHLRLFQEGRLPAPPAIRF
jgi:UDP-glucose 4-epimerase